MGEKEDMLVGGRPEWVRLDAARTFDYSCLCRLEERPIGSVAQLGARLVRIEEVRGSNPLRSIGVHHSMKPLPAGF